LVGVAVGRTLVPGDNQFAAENIVNLSRGCHVVKKGQALGDAHPAIIYDEPQGETDEKLIKFVINHEKHAAE